MLKLFAIEFTGNFSAEVWGERRQNFVKGTRIVVTRDDARALARLGNKILAEKEVEFDDVFTKKDIKDAQEEAAPTKVETPVVEVEAPVVPVETASVTTEVAETTQAHAEEIAEDSAVETTTDEDTTQPEASGDEAPAVAEVVAPKPAKSEKKADKKTK